jgi:hypothetical protein
MIHHSDEFVMTKFAAAETALIIVAVIALGLGPLLTILSINALTTLAIPITLGTWSATVWLTFMILWIAKAIQGKR